MNMYRTGLMNVYRTGLMNVYRIELMNMYRTELMNVYRSRSEIVQAGGRESSRDVYSVGRGGDMFARIDSRYVSLRVKLFT